MASNDYYHVNKPPLAASSSNAAYYGDASHSSHHIPSTTSTPAPPYSLAPNALAPNNQPPLRQNTHSPFESVFDDHVYPADSTQDGFRHHHHHHPPSGSKMNTAFNGHGQTPYGTHEMQRPSPYGQQDTAYYGPSSGSANSSRPNVADDIPLQSRKATQPQKDVELNANDHVYDAPSTSRRSRSRRETKVGFGQLGMFGANRKGIPWVVYFFTMVQVTVFIGELVNNAHLTGSPIMTKPSFNPMVGPSTYVMINMGARYVACMHNVKEIQDLGQAISWPCPNSTSNDAGNPSNQCSLGQLCGFGGVPEPSYTDTKTSPEPNQWFRFITPMFLHAGLIHIGFNLLLQMTMGKEMEIAIGSIRFFLVYVSAGIFGNVMGANYAGVMAASTGASGALFGVIALTLLDLLYSWKDRRSPVKDLMFIMLDVVISFVLGLLPGLDNFAHIGGFLMGMGLGVCVLHSPNSLRRRLGAGDPSYASMQLNSSQGPPPFLKNPVGFFKGRKPLWWAWWVVRVGFLLTVVIVFFVLLNNFYIYHKTCSWCKYLSCIPINNWCELDNFKITTS